MDWYAVIIVPPKKVCHFVDKYRKKYAKYTEYVIPPHITIYPPFLIMNSNEKEIIDFLKKSFLKTSPIKVKCSSINYFEGSRGGDAYFELSRDSALRVRKFLIKATKSLKDKIKDVFKGHKYIPSEYIPHMTIAERIPKEVLPKVKKELSGFKNKIEFEVNSIYLYKQRSGSKVWKELAKIKF